MKLPLSAHMTNGEVAQLLTFIAKILLLDKSNLFRSRAYDEGAEVIAHLPYQLTEIFPTMTADEFEKKMEELPGVGRAISSKLRELYSTGNIESLQQLAADIPSGVWSLTQVHGIGAKKAVKLAEKFGLDDPGTAVPKLLALAKKGQLRELEGFGEKSEQQIIDQLQDVRVKERLPRADAVEIADTVRKVIELSGESREVIYLGSLRRESETVGDIDIGVATEAPKRIEKYIADNLKSLARIIGSGEKTMRILLDSGHQIDIKFAPPSEWGSFLQYFTGNKQHNIALREAALKKGLSLSEHGIKVIASDEQIKFSEEEQFYKYVGFSWVPPKERIGTDELKKYLL